MPLKISKKIMAILLLMAFFVFPFSIEAKIKIENEQLDKIEKILGITNFPFLDGYSKEDLKAVLNELIKPNEPEITYGIILLSAFDEMEFMDSVLSQSFLKTNKEYFNGILDERIDLFNYWKKTGQNMYKVWKKGASATPATLLAMESTEIINKTMNIFEAFKVLESLKQYRGLWRYFDERIMGESHEWAWKLANAEMGWAAKPLPGLKSTNKIEVRIEQQFKDLYEKWGPYATQTGISESYKKQLKEEMTDTLTLALKEYRANQENNPSWIVETIEDVKNMVNTMKEEVKSAIYAISELNPFNAGPIVNSNTDISKTDSPTTTDDIMEAEPILSTNILEVSPSIFELPSTSTEEILEVSTTTDKTIEIESLLSTTTDQIKEIDVSLATTTDETIEEKTPKKEEINLCKKEAIPGPGRYRVLINEIAWMGSEKSSADEWIELKNVWGIPVNLEGWQLIDKDQQIKVIFEKEDFIPAGGYYLLERTDDNSSPEALANKIYSGSLSNSDEVLYLFDNNCRLEDEVIAESKWSAGNNSEKITMERFDVENWYDGKKGGTAGKENTPPPPISVLLEKNLPPMAGLPSTIIVYEPPKIIVTEIQIETGSSTDNDSIELYNTENEAKDISGFKIKKKTNSGTEYSVRVLPSGSIIQAKGYFVWSNYDITADATSTQTISPNNSIAIFDNDNNILDEIAWGSSTNPFCKGGPFSDNPNNLLNLGRKWSTSSQDYVNNNNNEEDFELQIPTIGEKNQNNEYQESEEDEFLISSLEVVINEIGWMGTKAGSSNEWIELYNNTTSTIDLTGWQITKDGEGWITISTSTISADSYFLLERTDDETISDILADHIFKGSLNNEGNKLELKNSERVTIDYIDCSLGWFTGKPSPDYSSMERINSASSSISSNWSYNNQITKNGKDSENNQINGTPRSENSVSKESTEIIGDRIFNSDFTLQKLGSPYIWQGSLIIGEGAKLTVEPGTVIKFYHPAINQPHAQIKVSGEIEAIGTEEEKIIFTSTEEDYHWDGLYLDEAKATIENVEINLAGKYHVSSTFPPYTFGAIYIDGGNINVKNSVIENSETYGVWIENSTKAIFDDIKFDNNPGLDPNSGAFYSKNSNPLIKNCRFENNIIGILSDQLSAPSIENNTFLNNDIPIKISSLNAKISGNILIDNTRNGIIIGIFGFSEDNNDLTVKNNNHPYIIESLLNIPTNANLTIEPGTIIKFGENGGINIEGNLTADGNQDDNIVFQGETEVPGSWKYIKFSGSSTDSIINNVIIKHGGFLGMRGGKNDQDGAITIENSIILIKNSVIENNLVGIEMVSSNFATGTENVIVRNNTGGIYSKNGCPELDGINFENNDLYNIWPESCR
jgi:hypothetical protein